MNERPITIRFHDLLRRPLFRAALCSVVLHLPLLAVLTPGWLQKVSGPEAGHLQVTLLAQPQPQPQPGYEHLQPQPEPPFHPQPQELMQQPAHLSGSQTSSDPLPAIITVSEPVAASELASAPPAVHSPALQPVIPSSPPLRVVTQTQTQTQTQTETQTQTDTSTAPEPVPMTGPETAQIREALETLLQSVNDHGWQTELLSPAQIAEDKPLPESLGLPASDSINITAVEGSDLSALQQVDITLVRNIAGQAFQMQARLRERALSHYAKFINRWDDNVMLSNDRIDGRFHVNSTVNFESAIDARPQFNGEVTIASRQSVTRRLRESTMFAEGLRTGIGRIPLPGEMSPAHRQGTGAVLLTLESDARLEFQGDDGVVWTDIKNNTMGRVPVPESGLIIEGGERTRFELSGTVAGKVLVYSRRQLVVTGDLVYANKAPDSSDSLALISEGSIEIAPASVTGAGDLEIHGALYARQRFSVRRFRDRYQGTLYVYGTLVAGSVSATEPRFNTHIEYDSRFDHSRPPAFPSTGLYDLVAWDQHWTAVTDSDAFLAGVADNAPIAVP